MTGIIFLCASQSQRLPRRPRDEFFSVAVTFLAGSRTVRYSERSYLLIGFMILLERGVHSLTILVNDTVLFIISSNNAHRQCCVCVAALLFGSESHYCSGSGYVLLNKFKKIKAYCNLLNKFSSLDRYKNNKFRLLRC